MKLLSLCSFCAVGMVMLLLSGCCPEYFTYVKDRFPVAGKLCLSADELHQASVRVMPIRPDGLETRDILRVLYRSHDVIAFHEYMTGECAGERDEIVEKKIKEKQKDNEERTVFFVSMYGVKDDWSFTVHKDGYIYKAAEIKAVDLDRTYQIIFGKAAFRYLQHIYQVTFEAELEPPFEFFACNGIDTACTKWC